jgi:hypothetical protein
LTLEHPSRKDGTLVAKREQANAEKNEYRYRTSGSGALQPEIQPKTQPEEPRRSSQGNRTLTRSQARRQRQLAGMRLRPAEDVAPLSVIGMVAVAVLAAFVICLRIQLNDLNTQLNTSSTELAQLEKEGDALLTQYEQMFDMGSIESGMLTSGKMTKPTSSQSVYLELAEPDHAEVFQNEEGVFQTIRNKLMEIVEYFQ